MSLAYACVRSLNQQAFSFISTLRVLRSIVSNAQSVIGTPVSLMMPLSRAQPWREARKEGCNTVCERALACVSRPQPAVASVQREQMVLHPQRPARANGITS